MTQDKGASDKSDRATHEQSPQAVSAVPVGIPSAIAECVLRMGKVEWGAVSSKTDEEHVEDFRSTLAITREHFNTKGLQHLHGLYLTGTETVLCHTGTSPNSGTCAQALAGAWNQLVDLCAAQAMEARQGGDAPAAPSQDDSPVRQDAPKGNLP